MWKNLAFNYVWVKAQYKQRMGQTGGYKLKQAKKLQELYLVVGLVK